MNELYTVREAAEALGVSVYQARYVMMTRPVPRRRAGNVDLVTLRDLRDGLADVDQRRGPRESRASA